MEWQKRPRLLSKPQPPVEGFVAMHKIVRQVSIQPGFIGLDGFYKNVNVARTLVHFSRVCEVRSFNKLLFAYDFFPFSFFPTSISTFFLLIIPPRDYVDTLRYLLIEIYYSRASELRM